MTVDARSPTGCGRHVPSLSTLARVVEAGGMRLVLGFERNSSTGTTGERIVVSV